MELLVEALRGAGPYVLVASAALFLATSVIHLLAVHHRVTHRRPTPRVTPPVEPSELEVSYLERMYAAAPLAEPVPFRVGEVVAGAAQRGRALGLKVSVISRNEPVEGVPADLATVLDTLVTNVSRNSWTRDMLLRSQRSGAFVEVVVGPATPEGLDTGLGLHISRNLLREQGGDLVVRHTAQGRSFVARVPAQRTPSQTRG